MRLPFGGHHSNLNKDDPYYQRRKCSAETLVCEEDRVMPNESGVVENCMRQHAIFTARSVA